MSKKQENKYDPTLVSTKFIEALALARSYGIKKHGHRNDWLTTKPNEHFKSAARHLNAAVRGEAFDEDSGLPHIVLAACNLMFEIDRDNYTFDTEAEIDKERAEYASKLKQQELEFIPKCRY